MTWKKTGLSSSCLLAAVVLTSCATPATRSELTPIYSGQASSQIAIGVVDSRSYVLNGDKEPWFEGIVRGGFGIPYTFNRPNRPRDETFADRIAEMLTRTFTDAGGQVTVVKLAPGLPRRAAIDELLPYTKDVALLVRIHESKFDVGGFKFAYPFHFQLSVLDREGNILAQASVAGHEAHTPSSTYNIWDMYGVVYKSKFQQLLAKPEIQLAITSPSRTVPVEEYADSNKEFEGTDLAAPSVTGSAESQREQKRAAASESSSAEPLPRLEENVSVVAVSASSKSQSEQLRVAILPFATRRYGGNVNNVSQWEIPKFSGEFVALHKDLTLAYSYYVPGFYQGLVDPDSIWEGGDARKVPKESQIYEMADQLKADAALTYWFSPQANDMDLYSVDVYVFDLKQRRLYHDSGNEGQYKDITEQLFEKLIREKERPVGKLASAASESSQLTIASSSMSREGVPSGATTVSTLATSKMPHEEGVLSDEQYKQKQGEIIEGQQEEADDVNVSVAAVGMAEESQSKPLRVAILPFASGPSAGYYSDAEVDLVEFSHEFVKERRNLELVYSYYSPKFDSKLIGDSDSYWTGGFGRQKPIESQVYAVTNHLDVDVVLMYFYRSRTADVYATELYNADVYLFDIRQKHLYRHSGDERDVKGRTRQVFEELIQARETSGSNS